MLADFKNKSTTKYSTMATAQIVWQITGQCSHGCWYCLPKYRNNPFFKETKDYLHVIDLLQNHGRRREITNFHWYFKGGEPLQFPNFNVILKAARARASTIKVETSGGKSWFDLLEIIDLVDEIQFTHHYWQQEPIIDFVVDLCREKNKKLKLLVPLLPGRIIESREKVNQYRSQGVDCDEQPLRQENWSLSKDYSLRDLNIYHGRAEDWIPPKSIDDKTPKPDPKWRDPTVGNGSPSYTGKPCYAGVDYISIDSRGFAQSSDCGGRDIGNVFALDWRPPDQAFACTMLYCHSANDRKYIRIIND